MIGRLGEWAANLLDCALNRIAPPIDYRAHTYLTTLRDAYADSLADAEADLDVWEPACHKTDCVCRRCQGDWCGDVENIVYGGPSAYGDEPLADWELEVLGINTPNPPAGTGSSATDTPPPSSAQQVSAGPDNPSAPADTHQSAQAGADGSPIADDVATIVAVILRGQGIQSAPIFADLIARELRHHFTFQRKTTE